VSAITTTPGGPTVTVSAESVRRVALIAGAAGIVLAALGGLIFNAALFFQSYLWVFLACLGLVLGSQVLLMIQYLTGGRWGFLLRRIFEANTRCMPLVTLFFLPLLLGLRYLYPWVDNPLPAKTWYLYLGLPLGFIPRAVIYFAFWNLLTWTFNRWSLQLDEAPTPSLQARVSAFSGLGIVAWAISILFAATDWGMSLEPEWFSTMYPPLLGVGQILLAFAFGIIVVLLLGDLGPLGLPAARPVQRDLGNLLMAFVLLFTYMAFSQFLLIYSGNLPEEIPYYITRKQGGWGVLIGLVGLFLFATPFLLLLQRDVKKNPNALLGVATMVLVMRLADLYWQIMPAFGGPDFERLGRYGHVESGGPLMDVAVLAGLGGLYLAFFLWQLPQRPLVARYGAEQLQEAAAHG
jgi:hypothetical protein